MRWTPAVLLTNGTGADGEVVWSWRPDAGVKLAEIFCRRQWQESPVTGESAKETVKTIARGKPVESGVTVVTTSCAHLFLHARLRVQRAPGFPCALCFGPNESGTTRAFSRGEIAEGCVQAQLVHLAPLAGRGRRRREAKSPGEGDYPRVRACLRLPLTRSQDARDLSPQAGRGEERSPCKQWIAFEIKSEIQRRRPGQASESKRDPGPTRERNALIATPRLLVGHKWPIRFTTTNIGGYGSLLSQGRRTVRGEIAQVCVISRRIAV